MISDGELLRYSRQIMLPRFDVAGQERLLNASVLLVGAGGLGCAAALYLVAAGVGRLVLWDGDTVEQSNLQRQVGFTEQDLGEPKAKALAHRLARLNRAARIEAHDRWLEGDAIAGQVGEVDLVVDASDNFLTRLDLNRACIAAGRPLVSGAAIGSEGQVTVFHAASGTPCYRCLYGDGEREENLSCSENGVLAPVVGVIGALQALEAVKFLSGYGEPLLGHLLLLDGWTLETRRVRLKKNPQCPHCSKGQATAVD